MVRYVDLDDDRLMGKQAAKQIALRRLYGTRPILGRSRLGDADPSISVAQFYYDLIIPILNAACQSEGATSQECATFQLRLTQCQQQLSVGIEQVTAGNPASVITLAQAAWCMKELYDDVKDAFQPDAPPPPPPPVPLPPKPETGIPWWAWALGGVGALGAIIGIVLAVKK